jgi:hypothetical protein
MIYFVYFILWWAVGFVGLLSGWTKMHDATTDDIATFAILGVLGPPAALATWLAYWMTRAPRSCRVWMKKRP